MAGGFYLGGHNFSNMKWTGTVEAHISVAALSRSYCNLRSVSPL